MRLLIPAILAATIVAAPAFAQTEIRGVSTTTADGQTTTLFAIAPQSRVAAADYVKMSADALTYRIAAVYRVDEPRPVLPGANT